MSLILDALKKLEREKEAHEPNVLVVGAVPWGVRARSRLPLAVALAAGGLLALVVFALWPRGHVPRPAAAPPAPEASPAPTPALSGGPPMATPAPASALSPPEPRHLAVPPPGGGTVEAPPSEPVPAQDVVQEISPAPSRAAAPGADELRLNAISQRDGRPVALINDRLVFEGDGFDGVKVLRIGEAEVEVEVRGERRVLRF